MAEKYGEKPEKFTAKFFEYIWNYYKWYIIAFIVAIVLGVFTTFQIRNTPHYDVTLTVAGDYLYGDDDVEKIKNIINNAGDDINDDGEVTTDVYQLIFIGDDTTDSAYDTRFTLQLQEQDAILYLMDKKRFDRIIEQSFGDEAFTPVEEWYDGVTSDDNIYYSDGKAYGVKILSGNTFKENGLTDGDLYLAVRKNYRSPEKTQKLYDNCKKIANIISK